MARSSTKSPESSIRTRSTRENIEHIPKVKDKKIKKTKKIAKKKLDWERLPTICLEKIFSLLGDPSEAWVIISFSI